MIIGGPVTCLAIQGNRAVIVIEDRFGPANFEIVDNSASGTPDTIAAAKTGAVRLEATGGSAEAW